MGGRQSQEFMVPADAGEDTTAFCEKCGYASNTEIAQSVPNDGQWTDIVEKKKVHTPNLKTVEEVSNFLKFPQSQMLKSLVYMTVDALEPVMILIRGDHQLNEEKVSQYLGEPIRAAHPEEVKEIFGVPIGFLGPVDAPDAVKIIADEAYPQDRKFATGANEENYHIMGWTLDEIRIDGFGDFRIVEEGEGCIDCGNPLSVRSTIEIGHIFKLGTKYSDSMGATFTDSSGEEKPIIMGCFGIGVGRIIASAIELYADKYGIVLPITIAPYEVIITAVDVTKPEVVEAAEKIYNELKAREIDVLYDDRDLRAGFKFKDAELIGIPIRVTVGRKVDDGKVEVVIRPDASCEDLMIENAVEKVMSVRKILFDEILKSDY